MTWMEAIVKLLAKRGSLKCVPSKKMIIEHQGRGINDRKRWIYVKN